MPRQKNGLENCMEASKCRTDQTDVLQNNT